MIKIYTDGSCLNNPGNGGWAAIINDNGKISKITGNEKNTTHAFAKFRTKDFPFVRNFAYLKHK